MKKKDVVLYDSYEGQDFDDIKQDLIDNYGENEVTDAFVYQVMEEYDSSDWNWVKSLLKNKSCYGWIIKGKAGLWNGTYDCMKVFDTAEQMIQHIIKDCGYIKIWHNDGHLFIKASHHDGTHEFEMKTISRQGISQYRQWETGDAHDQKNCYEMLNFLWSVNFFTALPHIENEY